MLTPYPDASLHNPEPGYFRRLLNAGGLTYADAAEILNCCERTVASYAATGGYPYPVQFTLECHLAKVIDALRLKKDANSSCSSESGADTLLPKVGMLR